MQHCYSSCRDVGNKQQCYSSYRTVGLNSNKRTAKDMLLICSNETTASLSLQFNSLWAWVSGVDNLQQYYSSYRGVGNIH